VYTFLKSQKTGDIRWNFTKFLISRDGEVLERFEPTVTPEGSGGRCGGGIGVAQSKKAIVEWNGDRLF